MLVVVHVFCFSLELQSYIRSNVLILNFTYYYFSGMFVQELVLRRSEYYNFRACTDCSGSFDELNMLILGSKRGNFWIQ